MTSFKISNEAKNDLVRVHQYGVQRFGVAQADKYFDALFEHFERIARNPFAFEPIDNIKKGYRRCVCGSDSMYYRINHDVVEVMAIIGQQDLDKAL